MEYRRLGKSGVQVSALSFGSWVTFGAQIDAGTAGQCMKAAYDAGVNFFDNAEAYAGGKSETMMGAILKDMRWDRSTFLVSSKVFWGGDKPNQTGLSRKHVVEACHAALRRLQVEYLDFYFCHRPDPNTPVEETVRAMHDLIRQGKVLYWGTSEWSAPQIMDACAVSRRHHLTPPAMEQPQYHMFCRERVEIEYARLYSEIGLGATIWSPLASGLLTGKYNAGVPADSRLNLPGYEWLKDAVLGGDGTSKIEKVKRLSSVAGDLGATLPQLGLAWCLKNPNVSSVITGASRAEQVKENMKAVEVSGRLTGEVMERIEGILQNKPKLPDF